MLWRSNIKGKNLCTGQKIEPDIEFPIKNLDNKFLKLRRIKDFEERYISFRHIIELKFNGVDDAKVTIVEYEGVGYSLDSYGGRSNIELCIHLIHGEKISICLGEYYVEIDDINRLQKDLKHYMDQGIFG